MADGDAWRRGPWFGENDPLKEINVDVFRMMQVALGPGLGVGNRRRLLLASAVFSKAAVAAFELSLEDTAPRWDKVAISLHESLQSALVPSGEGDPSNFNIAWFVYSMMGLRLKDLLPDRSDGRPSDLFHVPVKEFKSVDEFNRLSWSKKLTKYFPPSAWKKDPEVFLRLAEKYRRISNKCHHDLPKRTRNDGRPVNEECINLRKWVKAQALEPEDLSRQLKKWARLLVVWSPPREDMPPFADGKNADGSWMYHTEFEHAEAFAKWWDCQADLKYRKLRDLLKNAERDAKRAEQKKRTSQ